MKGRIWANPSMESEDEFGRKVMRLKLTAVQQEIMREIMKRPRSIPCGRGPHPGSILTRPIFAPPVVYPSGMVVYDEAPGVTREDIEDAFRGIQ